jgi:PAS domain S-box-containing protein
MCPVPELRPPFAAAELEERFRAIATATLDPLLMLDQAGAITFANEASLNLLGLTAGEALGRPFLELLTTPGGREEYRQDLDWLGRGAVEPGGLKLDLEIMGAQGVAIPIALSLSPVTIGGRREVVASLRDITNRRRLEEEREEQGHLLRSILDNIPNPIFYLDTERRFLGCNLAFEASVNRTREALVGSTVFDLLPTEEAGPLDQLDQALLERGGMEVYPLTVTGPLGETLHYQGHKAVFYNHKGELRGMVGSLMDLTAEKQAEEALRRNQDLLTILSDHVMDLMSIVEPTGRRIYTSPSYRTVLGYTEAELEAMAPFATVHPEDLGRAKEAIRQLFQGQAGPSILYRLRHREGHWLHFEGRAALVTGGSAAAPRALLVARDVTARETAELERKSLEVQLRHAQKLEAIGSLAAGIAHEINTPTQYIGDNATFLLEAMGAVMGFLSAQRRFLEDHQHLPGLEEAAAEALKTFEDLDLDYLATEVPRAIQQSLEGVARVTSIVSAMKDFSHPGGDEKAPVDLNRSIQNTLMVSRNEWKYLAELATELDPNLAPVPCFQGEFNQALLNLVINAAHAIQEATASRGAGYHGLIRVATRQEGAEVVVSVTDNGSGIPPALRDRIFEPFFTTKPVGKGTGQGLAIVHAVVVDKHKGRITVDSEPGQGTTFHLHLPLASEERP